MTRQLPYYPGKHQHASHTRHITPSLKRVHSFPNRSPGHRDQCHGAHIPANTIGAVTMPNPATGSSDHSAWIGTSPPPPQDQAGEQWQHHRGGPLCQILPIDPQCSKRTLSPMDTRMDQPKIQVCAPISTKNAINRHSISP